MNLICEGCGKPCDEFADKENDYCEECVDKWNAEQDAFWRPLYEGEKLGGFLDKGEDK